ncbi:hypothetical protein N7516_004039, partial [Penicillium verrucosum]|uniref:uncharacterized protein n=1 Tax=Penicillium verrucosum TaxID=60171 RepID=UPI0025455CD5
SWALTSDPGPQYYEDFGADIRDFELAYSISAPWSSDNAVFGFWIGINEYLICVWRTEVPFPQCAAYRSESYGHRRGTWSVKTYATWVKAYNDGLQSMISDFKSSHSDVRLHLLHYFHKTNLAIDYYHSVRYLVLYVQDPGRSSTSSWIYT